MHSPLLTDLYQLTMGYGYWKCGLAEREAVFHLFYRRAPFGGDAAIVAGTGPAADFLNELKFDRDELQFLAGLTGADGAPLFDAGYLDYLRDLEWDLEVDVIPEGEISLPHEPLMRIKGPLIQCQLVETALLNIVNFQTLIATQAARICAAAGGDDVFEFGLRRAQGPDGGLSASRAAYIGGCAASSNVLAGMKFGIPVKGTHAHSWVMSFDSEREAFDRYAEAMPNNAVFLVDTYDTLKGVQNAIESGRRLREKGHDLLAIRLDSGDLAGLSIAARELLDEAGFEETKIVASNDLDEESIVELKKKGARIDVWGIGTRLVTASVQPALGGVYKLGAIRDAGGAWKYRIKLSNDLIKVSNPGILQIERTRDADGHVVGDRLCNEADGIAEGERLLVPAVRKGRRVLADEPVAVIRDRAIAGWRGLAKRIPVLEIDPALEQTKRELLVANGFKA
ncbi:nicotinate phosphoribosyltransferase [Haloferula sp.]|uniref:nicotinate phosphoribosyltransferase n=1 Tax=Haloferula sp. TaxID=2497595 RepID=UPI003C714984